VGAGRPDLQNDAFAIQQIDVQTDGVLTSEAIRALGQGQDRREFDGAGFNARQTRPGMQPPIQFVAVERVLPHTLKLTVNEREPVAQTIVTLVRPGGAMDQAVYDFDEDGYVMKPLDPRWRTAPPPANERLPILVGVPPADRNRASKSPRRKSAPRWRWCANSIIRP
jgi:hypothetical protein